MAVRIGVDAMGGDHAPHEIIRGVCGAMPLLDADDRVVLYGMRDSIEPAMVEAALADDRVEIRECSQVIGMDESPVDALRTKRDSSLVRMASAAGKGELDCVISAGNTGAFAAACQLRIKPIPGISRPGIGVVLPTFHGPVLLCDVGANVAPRARHLYEYARMGSVYARAVLKLENPKVGIVSIGEEAGKGNVLVKQAAELVRRDAIFSPAPVMSSSRTVLSAT
jgi:glycerol-3-phosphate acyltransferase PlsX